MNIKGHLGGIRGNRVWGWAMDSEVSDPVEVHLYINAKYVCTRKASVFRKGILEKGIHPTGHCGFVFHFDKIDWDTIYSSLGHYAVSVKVGPEHTPLKRVLVYEQAEPKVSAKPQMDSFFFVHIPKTAGTALRFQLVKNFGKGETFVDGQMLKQFNGRYPDFNTYLEHASSTELLPRLWVGHVPFALFKYLSPDVRTLTMMRDPVERVISALVYLQKMHPVFQRLTLEEIFEKNKRTRFFNLQSRYFADTDINKLVYFEKKRAMDEQGLEQAKQNLAKCDFVGLKEQFNASLKLLSRQYGFSFTRKRKINKTPGKSSRKIAPAILEEIPSLVEYDQKLYDFARELFDKQWR